YAPEPGTRPDTAHRSFKLRLPDRRTAPVSTAIMNLMTTNMQIDIENKIIKKSRNKKPSNPIWSVVWRFLLFCAIFDGGVYFYFHSIQNTTVAEGIRKIRIAIHGNEDQKIERLHKTNIHTSQKKISIQRNQKAMENLGIFVTKTPKRTLVNIHH
ncbi:MAG: hypothetical protein EOM62_13890, partial [Bacteroidia bacterium]|nr:hypothetical protein [Bacteroidia bacterium]